MSTATDMLALYLDAEMKVLRGVTVRIGDKSLTRANLPEIIAGRKEWQERVNAENAAAAGRNGLGYSVANLSGYRGPFGECA